MSKKLGPLPLWTWIVLLAAAGYVAYRYEKSRSESTGVEEGYFPTQGIPAEGAEGTSTPGGGVAALSEGLRELENAGFVPAGSEAARQEAPAREALEGPGRLLEGGFETFLGNLLAGQTTKAKKPEGSRKPRGKAAGKRQPKRPNTGHKPGHTQTPRHSPAAHPRQRIGVGAARPAGGGGKRRRAPSGGTGKRRKRR